MARRRDPHSSVAVEPDAALRPPGLSDSLRRRRPVARRVPPDYISAGIILLDGEGRVLLQLRDDRPDIMFPNHWGITGGAGREGESPAEIARREVREETGLDVADFAFFRTYTFPDRAGDREVHIFFAPVASARGVMRVGEGRALRFFAPGDLARIDIAYNHREVLAEFLASDHYRRYLGGDVDVQNRGDAALAEGAVAAVAALREDIAAGRHWFDALLQIIAAWTCPEETIDGRTYRYLLEGEAFDWLLLAERICEQADGLVPPAEKEDLLFFGRPPIDLAEEDFRRAIGWEKYRAHLNYLYGVTVEEALQLAVEEEVEKERRAHVNMGGLDTVFHRLYGRSRDELLAEFRAERSLPAGDVISYGDFKRFIYWLFKYRVRTSEPARVASDTRKALAQLSRMEASVRRSGRRPAANPVVVDVSEGTNGVR